jgi:hypothetical protein
LAAVAIHKQHQNFDSGLLRFTRNDVLAAAKHLTGFGIICSRPSVKAGGNKKAGSLSKAASINTARRVYFVLFGAAAALLSCFVSAGLVSFLSFVASCGAAAGFTSAFLTPRFVLCAFTRSCLCLFAYLWVPARLCA